MNFVYVHKRATDGRVFYVGKGRNNRHLSKYARNKHWHHIVKKYGFIAEIVMRFNSEECAFSFERALIKHYGRSNLCNLTDGGEGVGGCVRSCEQKKKYSMSKLGEKNPMYGKSHTDQSREKMKLTRKGKKPSLGMVQSDKFKEELSKRVSGMLNPKADKVNYIFFHKDHGFVTCTQYELRKSYSLSNHVSGLVSGKHKSVKGWTVIK